MSAQAPDRAAAPHRERLLRGLEASLREKDLQAIQIGDVVRHARTSRRTFYECFPDKESCFVELIAALSAGILHEVRAAIDFDAPWDRQIDQAIDGYLAALNRDSALAVTISRDLATLGARGAALHQEAVERYARLLAEMVRSPRARRDGVPEISFEAAIMLMGGIRELLERAIAHGEDLERIGPVAKDVLKAVLDPARRA